MSYVVLYGRNVFEHFFGLVRSQKMSKHVRHNFLGFIELLSASFGAALFLCFALACAGTVSYVVETYDGWNPFAAAFVGWAFTSWCMLIFFPIVVVASIYEFDKV